MNLYLQPTTLLPKRLADVQDDIGSEKVRLSTLADVRDRMEIDRLGLQKKNVQFINFDDKK